MILKSEVEDKEIEVEFIYDYKYLIRCVLVPDLRYDFFEDAFYLTMDQISFGDITGRSYEFMFDSDHVFMLYEVAAFAEEKGNAYLSTVFIPEKKLWMIIGDGDLDVSKTLHIIKEIIYDNKNVGVSLVAEIRNEDNL